MNKKALVALKGSIEKWKRITNGKGHDDGSHNCPLCLAFQRGGCDRCPVYSATGYPACRETPYVDWIRHQELRHTPICLAPTKRRVDKDCPLCYEAAAREWAFLKSLLLENKRGSHT
jgi:hypothetical protein